MTFPDFANPQHLRILGLVITIGVVATTYFTSPFRALKERWASRGLKADRWKVSTHPTTWQKTSIRIFFSPIHPRTERAMHSFCFTVHPYHPDFKDFNLLKVGDVIKIRQLDRASEQPVSGSDGSNSCDWVRIQLIPL
jgi:hypothetical protein